MGRLLKILIMCARTSGMGKGSASQVFAPHFPNRKVVGGVAHAENISAPLHLNLN